MNGYYVVSLSVPYAGKYALPQGHRIHSVLRDEGVCATGRQLSVLVEVDLDAVESKPLVELR